MRRFLSVIDFFGYYIVGVVILMATFVAMVSNLLPRTDGFYLLLLWFSAGCFVVGPILSFSGFLFAGPRDNALQRLSEIVIAPLAAILPALVYSYLRS